MVSKTIKPSLYRRVGGCGSDSSLALGSVPPVGLEPTTSALGGQRSVR